MQKKINLTKAIEIIGALSFASILLACSVYLQKQLLAKKDKSQDVVRYEQQARVEQIKINTIKKMPAFGFGNLLADWCWLQFLQYFGDSKARKNTGFIISADYYESIVNHDPRFVRAYFLLAPATSIFAGEPERAIKAMSKGLESITPELSSESYYLWVYKGIDEMMFLNDIESAKESYKMASIWAEQSDHLNAKNSAANIKQTVEFLDDNPDSLVAQIGAWTLVLNSTAHRETQDKALEKIEELGGQIIVTPGGGVRVRVPEEPSRT